MSVDPATSATLSVVNATAAETTKVAASLAQQILGPPAAEIGETLRIAIRAKLAPLRAKWLNQVEAGELALELATRKLRDVPPEQVATPAPALLAGVVEGLQTRSDDPELREMFANLLATAMHGTHSAAAHPAFAEIIRQLTADEARLFQYVTTERRVDLADRIAEAADDDVALVAQTRARLVYIAGSAGCEDPARASEYVDNLLRLGLVDMPQGFHVAESQFPGTRKIYLKRSHFGKRFALACLVAPAGVADLQPETSP